MRQPSKELTLALRWAKLAPMWPKMLRTWFCLMMILLRLSRPSKKVARFIKICENLFIMFSLPTWANFSRLSLGCCLAFRRRLRRFRFWPLIWARTFFHLFRSVWSHLSLTSCSANLSNPKKKSSTRPAFSGSSEWDFWWPLGRWSLSFCPWKGAVGTLAIKLLLIA